MYRRFILKAQSDQIIKKWEELVRINDVIQRKINFIEEETKNLDVSSIRVQHFGARYYIPIGKEELLYSSNDFYFYPTVVFYCGDEKEFGALISKDGFDICCGHVPLDIREGDYLCAYHTGPYSSISQIFATLYKYAENHNITLADKTVNLNIIDQFVESDKNKYITEVQILILD